MHVSLPRSKFSSRGIVLTPGTSVFPQKALPCLSSLGTRGIWNTCPLSFLSPCTHKVRLFYVPSLKAQLSLWLVYTTFKSISGHDEKHSYIPHVGSSLPAYLPFLSSPSRLKLDCSLPHAKPCLRIGDLSCQREGWKDHRFGVGSDWG